VAEAVVSRPLDVYVVSDATGATAEALLTSALVHFEDAKWLIRRFPLVRSTEQVAAVVEQAASSDSVVAFTFVSPELGAAMNQMCRQHGVRCVDILNPLIGLFTEALERAPESTPGVFRRQAENMFRVARAIDFALQHDDGKGVETLDQADVLILGLSRSGKTPTTIYLSCRAVMAANIPIVKDMPIPERVLELDVPKVGLRMSMDRLLQIRSQRMRRMGTDVPWYANRAGIFAELEYCERVFRSVPGLKVINVTNRSVEEISDLVVREVL
jgi:regulator of PEP synthase PpsR (kinase-PPPase family)